MLIFHTCMLGVLLTGVATQHRCRSFPTPPATTALPTVAEATRVRWRRRDLFPRALREARYAIGAAVSPARHGGVAVGPHQPRPAGCCGGRRQRGWRVWRHCLTTAPRATAPRATGSGAFLCRPRQIWPHLRAAQVWRGRGGERGPFVFGAVAGAGDPIRPRRSPFKKLPRHGQRVKPRDWCPLVGGNI